MTFRFQTVCICLALSVPLDSSAKEKASCDATNTCRTGNRIEDAGYQSEPWLPYETDDPFVRAADACLGFAMTRKPESLGGGNISLKNDGGFFAQWGSSSETILISNLPQNKYGVFHCNTTSWPNAEMDQQKMADWIASRLTKAGGWTRYIESDLTDPSFEYVNESLGLKFRIWSDCFMNHGLVLEADYFGPPLPNTYVCTDLY